jgi:hypothetical protein
MMESRKLALSRRRNGEQYEDAGNRAYRRTVYDMHDELATSGIRVSIMHNESR